MTNTTYSPSIKGDSDQPDTGEVQNVINTTYSFPVRPDTV
jgi:hypothetical protein